MIRSIHNRIALWHVLMFTVMSLVSFFLIYQLLDRFLLLRTEQSLVERVKRNEWYGNNEKKLTLDGHIDYCMNIEGTQAVFYLVFNPDGAVFASPKTDEWKSFEVPQGLIQEISSSDSTGSDHVREIVPDMIIRKIEGCPDTTHVYLETVPFNQQNFRICYARLRDAKVLLCAQSLSQNEHFLAELRQTFWLVFGITIILGGIAGLFLANRSVSGLKKVTRIAGEIELGNFERRLDSSGEGIEIENLAEKFNAMLDKIQVLLVTLSNVSDDIAHDLRTPITRIRGTAEMVLCAETRTLQQDETAFCSIIEECDRLVVMIKTMLEITQTDSGVLELELEDCDLWDILRKGYQLFAPLAEDHQLKFTLEMEEESAPVFVRVNLSRIQRAIANLLDNAIKFTAPNGEIRLIGKTTADAVWVQVWDTGIGIPREEQEKVFNRFYRSDPSRTVEGNGLGLCLARSIVQAHKGELLLESNPGEGCCFTIRLPFSRSLNPAT